MDSNGRKWPGICCKEGSEASLVAEAGVWVFRLLDELTWDEEEGGWQNSSKRSA